MSFSSVISLYGLSEHDFSNWIQVKDAVNQTVADYEARLAPLKVGYNSLRQLLQHDFGVTQWWRSGTKTSMTIDESVYCIIVKLLLIPGPNFNPIVNCQIEADGIIYNQCTPFAYPHPKNKKYISKSRNYKKIIMNCKNYTSKKS